MVRLLIAESTVSDSFQQDTTTCTLVIMSQCIRICRMFVLSLCTFTFTAATTVLILAPCLWTSLFVQRAKS